MRSDYFQNTPKTKNPPTWADFEFSVTIAGGMDELVRTLKSQGVLKSRLVEAAFRATDRAAFVLPEHREEAYGNYPLPIGHDQTISQPYTVAFMLDLLDPRPGDRILEVGAGSGWQTALLAHIVTGDGAAGRVIAIERIPELSALARTHLKSHGDLARGGVELIGADASLGAPRFAPFDKIIAAAAAGGDVPAAWREQLKPGGTIVAPVGDAIIRYRKTPEGAWLHESFPGFAFVPLVTEPNPNGNQNALSARYPDWRAGAAVAAIAAAALLWATLAPIELAGDRRIVEIPPGSGSRAIGELLKERGVIRSKWLFIAYATLSGQADALRAGTYELDPAFNIPKLVRRLVRGEAYPNERTITIPEGWDLRDIGAYFASHGIATPEALWRITGAPAERVGTAARAPLGAEFDFLDDKPSSVGLEGYLFPDTYRIFRNAPASDIVETMLENFGRRLTPDLRSAIRARNETIFRIVTMASLVEKEVANDADRRIVSGILWRRLRAGIPLQVDASVNYATAKRQTPSQQDLTTDSGFNTYRYPGLPAGPIANPGLPAIRAAIEPTESDYLYYLSTPSGETIFSRTLKEHAAAKTRYLR